MAEKTKSQIEIGEYFEAHSKRLLEEYFTFLRFPGISADPSHRKDLQATSDWLKTKLDLLGFSVQTWQADQASPVCLFASCLEAGPKAPTILIYNHYDVQPVDPVDLWTSPPFEPELRHGQIYARGAQDNKGQCFYLLTALEALRQRGSYPVNIKLVIEGEEEVGSHGLSQLIPKHLDELKADTLLVLDVGMKSLKEPAITLGVRGVITMDVVCKGSTSDLHSGSHGGIVYNPIHALVEVLSALHDRQGRVTVPGFYDNVVEFSDVEKARLDLSFDEERYFDQIGAKATGGEVEFSPYERAWLRPTLEINGISGGYAGEGFKTVIPSEARAKVSCRLVANQLPGEVAERVSEYLEELAPPGVRLEVDVHPGRGEALMTSPDSVSAQTMKRAYEKVFQKPCRMIMEGGSIPIAAELAKASGAEPVFVGLALPDDHMHAPDEHFGLDRLRLGMELMGVALQLFGEG